MAINNLKKFAQPYTAQQDELTDLLFPSATTAQLANIADPINTQDKYQGKWVYNVLCCDCGVRNCSGPGYRRAGDAH